MRILRSSLYPPIPLPPITTVVRASDVLYSLEAVQEDLIDKSIGTLVIFEIFEMPDGVTIEQAALEAERRRIAKVQREKDQAMLYYWSLMHLRRLNPHGIMMSDRPAPLDAEEMKAVYFQIMRTKEYQNQRFIAFDQNGAKVEIDKNSKPDIPPNVS